MYFNPLAEMVLASILIGILTLTLIGAALSIMVLLKYNRRLSAKAERMQEECLIGITPAGHVEIARYLCGVIASGRSKNPSEDTRRFTEHLMQGRSEVLKIRQLFDEMEPPLRQFYWSLISDEFPTITAEDVH